MIKLFVFDMAGTTVDEDNIVYKTLRAAIEESGLSVSLDEVLVIGAGKEKLQAIKDVLAAHNTVNERLAEKIHKYFLEELEKAYRNLDVQPFPDVDDFFSHLKAQGIKVALNTGYDRATAEHLVQKIGWKIGEDIDALVTASDVSRNRPHPDMILKIMEELGVADPAEVAKVGDSGIDIEEGRNAGCLLCIGVTTGAQNRKLLEAARADHVVDNLTEIEKILDQRFTSV